MVVLKLLVAHEADVTIQTLAEIYAFTYVDNGISIEITSNYMYALRLWAWVEALEHLQTSPPDAPQAYAYARQKYLLTAASCWHISR